jgi:hypothetical protein
MAKEKKTKEDVPPKTKSLVENINAKKKAGTSATKSKSTVTDKAYKDMENNRGKNK